MTDQPSISASLTRKCNLGNYESVDIQMSVTLPFELAKESDLRTVVREKASEIYELLASEVSERYRYLKDMQASTSVIPFSEWRDKQEAKA